METARVDIVYRPLRIAWAIHSSDRSGFRRAVRTSYALWGGRFNPIILVDRPEAGAQIELFQPDFILPLGDQGQVSTFIGEYPFLINPLHSKDLFLDSGKPDARAEVLDIQNLLYHFRDDVEWKAMVDFGFRIPKWQDDDSLADVLLVQFGGYPDPTLIGIDYIDLLSKATMATAIPIDPQLPIPFEIMNRPGLSQVSSYGLKPHYSRRSSKNYAGHFAGDSNDIEDLVSFWNLRAAGISLMFFDINLRDRFSIISPEYERWLRANLAGLDEIHRTPALWFREKNSETAAEAFKGSNLLMCRIDEVSWNGLNVMPPTMHFGEESSLGVLGGSSHSPRVSFALANKPFSDEHWFYTQHLVASVSLIGGRSESDNYLFVPPYIPELNEFVSRAMYFDYDKIRCEPDRLGVVIDVNDKDIGLDALSVPALIEQVFGLAGFNAKLSQGGLITRQLISRMGGLGKTRAFKIPGVRRLLKTHGPMDSFTRKTAIELIGKRDPANPGASFDDHKRLFIEQRPHDTELTPSMVFSHLVEKKLFRIGADLRCPTCALSSWVPLETLQQSVTCSLCGAVYDATRQLVEGTFTYRRSGVLGLEKNNQGAIPVALLLQQLSVNFMSHSKGTVFGVSYDLKPNAQGSALPICETDFFILSHNIRSEKTCVVIGECKDAGCAIDADDISNLRKVADSFPKHRFKAYILFAKLAPFSEEEIELAGGLNTRFNNRVIMLTHRELEPYYLFKKTNAELGLDLRAYGPEDLANATHNIYFSAQNS